MLPLLTGISTYAFLRCRELLRLLFVFGIIVGHCRIKPAKSRCPRRTYFFVLEKPTKATCMASPEVHNSNPELREQKALNGASID